MIAFVFDTETTDLVKNPLMDISKQPRMIEFYGAKVNDAGEILDELEFMCHPGFRIEPITTKITGIVQSDLEGKPAFNSELADAIDKIMEGCDAAVAHNLSFDKAMVGFEFTRLGRDPVWPPQSICTVEETEWIKGYRLNMGALYEHLFGEGFSGAHRAKVDTAALIRCWSKLRMDGMI